MIDNAGPQKTILGMVADALGYSTEYQYGVQTTRAAEIAKMLARSADPSAEALIILCYLGGKTSEKMATHCKFFFDLMEAMKPFLCKDSMDPNSDVWSSCLLGMINKLAEFLKPNGSIIDYNANKIDPVAEEAMISRRIVPFRCLMRFANVPYFQRKIFEVVDSVVHNRVHMALSSIFFVMAVRELILGDTKPSALTHYFNTRTGCIHMKHGVCKVIDGGGMQGYLVLPYKGGYRAPNAIISQYTGPAHLVLPVDQPTCAIEIANHLISAFCNGLELPMTYWASACPRNNTFENLLPALET